MSMTKSQEVALHSFKIFSVF